MPVFSYTGRNGAGELVRGVLESADSATVASQLFATGIIPVEIGVSATPVRKAGEGWFGPSGRVSKPPS